MIYAYCEVYNALHMDHAFTLIFGIEIWRRTVCFHAEYIEMARSTSVVGGGGRGWGWDQAISLSKSTRKRWFQPWVAGVAPPPSPTQGGEGLYLPLALREN
jgi:hypothetical protein